MAVTRSKGKLVFRRSAFRKEESFLSKIVAGVKIISEMASIQYLLLAGALVLMMMVHQGENRAKDFSARENSHENMSKCKSVS